MAAWYPITPSTSLVDAFSSFCDRFRKDPETGKFRGAIIQAEDELAAAGITIGAAWAGARAFTSTSGPGISVITSYSIHYTKLYDGVRVRPVRIED